MRLSYCVSFGAYEHINIYPYRNLWQCSHIHTHSRPHKHPDAYSLTRTHNDAQRLCDGRLLMAAASTSTAAPTATPTPTAAPTATPTPTAMPTPTPTAPPPTATPSRADGTIRGHDNPLCTPHITPCKGRGLRVPRVPLGSRSPQSAPEMLLTATRKVPHSAPHSTYHRSTPKVPLKRTCRYCHAHDRRADHGQDGRCGAGWVPVCVHMR
jgi:hypothetical protein